MTRQRVCRIDDLEPGTIISADVGERVAVCKVEGTVYAFQDKCTHAKAWLSDGWLHGAEVVCPFHMGRFSVTTGAATCLPAMTALRTFPVSIEAGDVFVEMEGTEPPS